MAKRKRPPPLAVDPPPAASPRAPDAVVADVVELMAKGLSRPALVDDCHARGLSEPLIGAALTAAAERLAEVAAYNRDQALGGAVHRAGDLYRRALDAGDLETALKASKEYAKLLGLYQPTAAVTPPGAATMADDQQAAELRAIADHLAPLALVPDGSPLVEVARVAAELIRSQQATTGPARRRPRI